MNLHKTIAELCWHYRTWNEKTWYYEGRRRGPIALAAHTGISEDEICKIMKSDEYRTEVKNLIVTTRSPAEIQEWIKTYTDMPRRFAKRMGLSEEAVSELIKEVLSNLES